MLYARRAFLLKFHCNLNIVLKDMFKQTILFNFFVYIFECFENIAINKVKNRTWPWLWPWPRFCLPRTSNEWDLRFLHLWFGKKLHLTSVEYVKGYNPHTESPGFSVKIIHDIQTMQRTVMEKIISNIYYYCGRIVITRKNLEVTL